MLRGNAVNSASQLEGRVLVSDLVRSGHLREEGGAAACEDVFHLNWLWLHRLGNMNFVPLREKE